MAYIQGFLLAVPKANKAAYTELATVAGKVFVKHGALSVMEAWGVDVPDGEVTSFPMAVKLKEDETVVFSWIIWADREAAEAGKAASMKEFEETLASTMSNMPFDGKRMMWGDFESIVEM